MDIKAVGLYKPVQELDVSPRGSIMCQVVLILHIHAHGYNVLSVRASGGCDYNRLTEAVCTHNIQSCWVTAILLKEKLDHGEVTSFSSHSDRTRLLCLHCRDRQVTVRL